MIIVNLDVMLARRKMRLGDLADAVGISMQNLSVLKTGKALFIRYWGTSQKKAVAMLDSFTLQGAVPEPIKVAKLAARAML